MVLNTNLLSNKPAFNFLILTLLITCCLGIYWPGLGGIFLLDDYHNLNTLNQHGGVTDLNSFLAFVFGNNSGTLGRPISMMSFLIDDHAWPSSPRSYKYTNLLLHLIGGLLIILFIYRIAISLKLDNSTARYIAFLCGALWIFHPLNVSTTLYVIQRMTQLTSIFMLVAILCYCHGRITYENNPAKALTIMTAGITFFGCLALLSKENGVLLTVYILIIESTIFQSLQKPKAFKIWVSIFILLPLIVLLAFFASRGFYVNAYEMRDFTFAQRLMTESRILIDYLYSILIPPARGTGLIHDDIVISTGLFTPLATFPAILANLSLIGSAFYFRKRQPVYAFSVFWFYGGHFLESTFIPLELYFEHRNYLPMVGPIFAVMFYLIQAYQRSENKICKRLTISIPIILIILSTVFSSQTIKVWSHPNTLFAVWAHEHPNSLRAQRIYAQNLAINGQHKSAIELLSKLYKKFPFDISLPLEIINVSCSNSLNSTFRLKDMPVLAKSATFTDGVWSITKNLVDSIVTGKCQQYTLQDAIALMAILETVDKIKLYDKTHAQMLFFHSDLYVLNRQLAPAIELLDRAYKIQKTVVIPLRQAQLLISAGLYQDAARYLELAKQTDSMRKKFTPSKLSEINKLENSIRNYL